MTPGSKRAKKRVEFVEKCASRKTPALSVDSRPRPPDLILITDWPIIAQPAMPPQRIVLGIINRYGVFPFYLGVCLKLQSVAQ